MSGNQLIPAGSGDRGQPGVYGTLGTPAPTNILGGRLGPIGWTDSVGNIWLFGGYGFDQNGTFGSLNDLWKYNPASGQWTWISGSPAIPGTNGGQPGIYGTIGISAAGNTPGGRTGAVAWNDSSGNLWLFGGAGFDSAGNNANLDDLWMFNPSTAQWTWEGGGSVAGNHGNPGDYGTMGVSAPAIHPGSRNFATAWTDHSGLFWIFGGYGTDSAGVVGELNDLWMFNTSTGQWTWESGSSSLGASGIVDPVYGTLGIAALGNTPGSRDSPSGWVDKSGNLWIFGGHGYTTQFEGFLNELWCFNTSSLQWTWMGGSSQPPSGVEGLPGIYGTLGVSSSSNIPGARVGAFTWTDSSGDLLLAGGEGIDAQGSTGSLNDLWQFSTSTGQWTWTDGSSTIPTPGTGQPGIYGVQGTMSAANIFGGRDTGLGLTDANGHFWLFGGDGEDESGASGYLNDLWEFVPAAYTPSFNLPAGSYTGTQTVSITDATPNATIYYTTDGSTPSIGSSVYSTPLTLTSKVTLQAIAVASNYAESAIASASYSINMLTPAILLTASANPAFASNAVTFTVTVSSPSGSPSGTVAFLDGTTQLGTSTISGGTATYTTSSLTAGSHSITAVYSGDTTFVSVTSAALNETIDDFTIAPPSGSSTSATVSPGGTATYTLAVTPPSGTTTPTAITFTVSGLPSGAIATFSPTPLPAGSGATNVTLSVAVPAQSSAVTPLHSPLSRQALPVALGILLLPLATLRRNRRLLTRTFVLFALCAASAIGLAALSGCESSGGSGTGSEPQSENYTLTVTATAGSLAHTTQLTLTVN